MEINRIKNELINQKKSKFKGNIYHYSQVNFSYNSNKIEGILCTANIWRYKYLHLLLICIIILLG